MNGSRGEEGGTWGTSLTQITPVYRPGGLVDQYGRPVPDADERAFGPPSDPILDKGAASVIKRDIPIQLITRWTSNSIQIALDEHMLGNFSLSAFLCDSMTGDDRVSATLGQRMGSLFSRAMKTTPCMNGVESDDAEAVAVAKAWDAAWDSMAPLSTLEEIHTWGIFEGVIPIEIQWDRSRTPWQPYFKPWHPTHLQWRWDLRKYTIVTQDGIEVINPGDGRWMLYTPHGPWRGWRRGCVRPTAVPWFARQLTWRDWPRFNERHGLPMIGAKSPARCDTVLRDKWLRGLATLGQEAVVSLPQNVDGTGFGVEIIEAKDRAYDSFDKFMARCDMAIVLAILWQNLTTEVTGGSYAAATVHEGIQQTAARFDNGCLTQAIYEQVARPFAAWNFGRPELAPRRTWIIEEPSDHLASAQTFSAFAKAISDLAAGGVKLSPAGVALLAHRFNLPLSADQIAEIAPAVASGETPPKAAP